MNQAGLPKLDAKSTAAWLFVLPLFTAGIAKYSAKIEFIGLFILAFSSIVILNRPIPRYAVARIYLATAALLLILFAYLAFRPWPAYFGSSRSYDIQAMIFVGTYVAVAVFAVLFLDEFIFERILWQCARWALWIGVLSCLASRLTGLLILVNPANSGPRMEGTLSEPSAWAPVIPLVVLLAIRHRSHFYVMLAILGLFLADSPTCFVVLVVTVPLYYALTGTWPYRLLLLLFLAIVIPVTVIFVQRANPNSYLSSTNQAEVTVGRLLSGIRNVETDGQQGTNSRFSSTTVVVAEVHANGWTKFGAGPAADSTYFSEKYPSNGIAYRTNSLWLSILFDFGEIGVVTLGILMLIAISWMRRHSRMAAIILPFFVASLINSAEGSFEYSFVALGILLFTFGWIKSPADRLSILPASEVARR